MTELLFSSVLGFESMRKFLIDGGSATGSFFFTLFFFGVTFIAKLLK